MKKIFAIVLVLLIPLGASAQKRMTFEQVEKKYAEKQGYTIIEVTETMLKMIGLKGVDTMSSEMLNGLKGISSMRIIMSDVKSSEFTRDMLCIAEEGSGYKLLTSVKEKKESVLIYFKESPKKTKHKDPARVAEILIVVYGESDNVLVNVKGDFSIKEITSIADQVKPKNK